MDYNRLVVQAILGLVVLSAVPADSAFGTLRKRFKLTSSSTPAPKQPRQRPVIPKADPDLFYVPSSAGGPKVISKARMKALLEKEGLYAEASHWSPFIRDLKLAGAIYTYYNAFRDYFEDDSEEDRSTSDT